MNKRNFLIMPVVFLGMLFVCTSCIDAGLDDGTYTQETDSVQTTSDADSGIRNVSEKSADSSDRERANKDKKSKETFTDAGTGNTSPGASAEGDAEKTSSGSSEDAGEGKTSRDISYESPGKSFGGSSSKKEDNKGNYEGQSQPCSTQSGTDTRGDKTSTDAASQSEDEVQTECRHSEWEPVYDVIHHDAVTVTEYVDTGKTQTEVVDEVVKKKCRCGEFFDTYADWQDHAYPYIDAGLGAQHSGFQDWPVPVYGEVPVYEAKVTIIQEAWDEQCIINYKCRACGISRW